MSAQRFGESKVNGRKSLVQLRPRRGQITADVDSRGQKIRHENHTLGSLLDTAHAALLDVRLGQFQKRRCDDRPAALPQLGGDVQQIRVGLFLPAAVGDEQQGRFHDVFLMADVGLLLMVSW